MKPGRPSVLISLCLVCRDVHHRRLMSPSDAVIFFYLYALSLCVAEAGSERSCIIKVGLSRDAGIDLFVHHPPCPDLV
jgi:hypothetical protein